jgi:hypothetical protein
MLLTAKGSGEEIHLINVFLFSTVGICSHPFCEWGRAGQQLFVATNTKLQNRNSIIHQRKERMQQRSLGKVLWMPSQTMIILLSTMIG